MSLCKFDTFENEVEMAQLIKNLQDKSYDYMKIRDPWDYNSSNPIKYNELV